MFVLHSSMNSATHWRLFAMLTVLALCVAVAALVVFSWLLRARLRRGTHRQGRRYFSVDLAPSAPPPPPET